MALILDWMVGTLLDDSETRTQYAVPKHHSQLGPVSICSSFARAVGVIVRIRRSRIT